MSVVLSFSSVQTYLANVVTSRVNSIYGTTILIDKVDLSSLRNVRLKNVLIKDHHQDTLIYIGDLSTTLLNYRNLIKGKLIFGDIEIENGKFIMKTYKGEESNNLTIFSRKFRSKSNTNAKEFQLLSSSVYLESINFSLINENKKETPIVYYNDISGYFDDFEIYGSTVKASIHNLKTKENHNVSIVEFKSNFLYSNTKMEFLQTELSTQNSSLSADIIFNYSLEDLIDFTDKVQIDANIHHSNIALVDLKKFYDEFGKNDVIHLKARAKGVINDFVLHDIDFKTNRNSVLKGTIHLKNALGKKRFKMEADLIELSSNYDHLKFLFPKLIGKKLPPVFERLGTFTSSGKLKVTRSSVNSILKTKSDIGGFNTDIEIANFKDVDNVLFTGKVELIDFNLGRLLNDSLIGELSMVGEINGKGFKIDKGNTQIKGKISKYQYKDYTYSNIDINGILMDNHFNGNLVVNDSNIQLIFKGLADLSGENYMFDFYADIIYADLNKLNLFKRDEKSILKGKIDINLTGTHLDNFEGDIEFIDASYSNQNDKYYFKDFKISSIRNDSIREVEINSTDIINGSIKGNFKFNELKKITINSLGSLFTNFKNEKVTEGQFLEFDFKIYNKIIDVFYPDVKVAANTLIHGEINSDENKFRLTLKSPKVKAYGNEIRGINMQVDTKNPIYNTLLSVDKVKTEYYNISDINLVNVTLNDTLFIRTDFIGGENLTEKYNLSFYHTINENSQSVFGIKRSNIFFKNNTWSINPNNNHQNRIVYDNSNKTYAIDNINIETGGQYIYLAGVYDQKEISNINLKFENVNLYDITPSIDSLDVGGKIYGSVNLTVLDGKTVPFADLRVNYFNINNDYYGDLTIHASADESIKDYNFEATLMNGDLKSFYSKGNIDFNLRTPKVNMEVLFDKFKISSFSPLGKNVISKIRGFVSGQAVVSGSLKNPDIEGEIMLQEAGLSVPYLNVNYNFIGKPVVKLYGQTFDFQTISIEDDLMKTTGKMSGTIKHREFKKWYLDLELVTDNLLVLNTKEKEDVLYYGTGLLSGKTKLEGRTDALVIDVEGKTNKGTEFIIPLSYISTIGESNLIHFEEDVLVKDDNSDEDIVKKKEDVVFEELKGLTLNFNLIVTKDAVAEVVIDKLTGSLLRGSGDGDLKLNIDSNGKFEMFGAFRIDNGEYKFKNIVNKNFIVKKGGTIVWNGSPLDANLNITAVNFTKANPAVLLDEINSSRKIDIDLITTITGSLSDAKFDFDISIPNASSLVKSELDFKLNREDDKLTQFFSILATGSFINLNQSSSDFNGNAAITGTIAQKASSVLSQILKSSNDDIQVGVSYDVGNTNSVEDVTTDDQLGISVSGRIADRVTVNGKVGVPVGSNTSSNVIGEVEIIIPLNEAETLQSKVYNRQNEIQFDVIDGEGYTQGVGISYRFDFDNTNEFFNKIGVKRTKEEKRTAKIRRDSLKLMKRSLPNE